MFRNRKFMILVALVATSIQAANADEATNAAEVLSKLWAGTQRYDTGSYTEYQLVGDVRTYKMRHVHHSAQDGTVEVTTEVAPFRFLEEDPAPKFASLHPMVGVKCLFGRSCIKRTTLTYDPVFHPSAQPSVNTWPFLDFSDSYGAVNPADGDSVKRALRTLIQLNAPPPFDPPK